MARQEFNSYLRTDTVGGTQMAKKLSELSRPEKPHRVKQKNMTITEKMQKELNALKRRKIDLSDKDSAEITEWGHTEVGKFYRPIKEQITIRIDADILNWFKHATNKYQTLINQACREYMIYHGKLHKSAKRKRA